LRPWLRSLLPTDPRYAGLRTALAATPANDVAMRNRLRINLERWRWMPRSLGSEHIYVNVPSYSLNVVDHGKLVSTYTVVVGKPSTPTPQITAEARSIVVNPWWNVPPSIQRHMKGGKGFVVKAGGGFAQPPGPRNALGKVKIDMPNQFNIYLHDTPSKSLFAAASRAYSHGCIRVKDVDRLAAELAALDKGSDAPVKQALAGSATRTLPLQHGRPVYLVYFTADVGPDGKIVTLDDPYGRDSQLIESLDAAPKLALNDQAKIRRS
jgi:murein L,D-transpeptidase YcbB/YkuD